MKQKNQSLLWQINHAEVDSTSFLFGTMHVRDKQAFHALENVYFHLQQCSAFAAEYDLSTANELNFSTAMLLPDNKRLGDYFRPAQYLKMQAILYKSFGIQIHQFSRFNPIFLINVISEKLLSRDHPQALDLELWEQAGVMGKLRLGIETLDEQLKVLQQIPLDHQLRLLRNLSRKVAQFRKATLKNTERYITADPQQLYQLVRRSSQGLRKILLFDRNHIMANRINEMAREQATFCAIGAGHLAGKEGVLRLLKLQGYRLRAIR